MSSTLLKSSRILSRPCSQIGKRFRSLDIASFLTRSQSSHHVSSSTNDGKHALILGASGITGWGVVNQLLSGWSEAQKFSKVTAMTNRPLSLEASQWPKSDKLKIVSGIDLSKGSQDELNEAFQRIPDMDTVSHVYFHTYKWSADPAEESHTNSAMLERSARAIEAISPKFEFLTLPTGTKAYGIHLVDGFPWHHRLPLRESLPRLDEPYASELFYYWQTDALNALSKDKRWTWCEVRPDLVVGFVPNNNAHCLAQDLGIYLSLFKLVHGKGAKVPWPGTAQSYEILSSESAQDLIARFSIWASLNPDKTGGGKAFNIVDSNTPATWKQRWSMICSLFDLEGGGYVENSMPPSQFVSENASTWEKMAEEKGLKPNVLQNNVANPQFFNNILSAFGYDHQISRDLINETGFTEEWEDKKSWQLAFERFRKGKIIP